MFFSNSLILKVCLILLGFGFGMQDTYAQESDAQQSIVHKFGVEGIESDSDSEDVKKILLAAPYFAEAEFKIDCTCFEVKKESGLTYDTIVYLLGKQNFVVENEEFYSE